MSETTVSVVIPTYNRASSLAQTLEALKAQTFPTRLFEVVVVSDGSTDDTEQVVEQFSISTGIAVQFIHQPNAGPSVARNKGIAAANNEVVVFLDDDVEPVPAFLECHAAGHLLDDRRAVIGPMSPDPARDRVDPAWILWEHDKLQRVYRLFQQGGTYANCEAGPMHFYSGNASVRRTWLVQAAGFDARYTRQEDVELAVRMKHQFGIRYFFDFAADGIHRPVRSFGSWLKVPVSYGRLDAQRLMEGTLTEEQVIRDAESRHLLSRLVVRSAAANPAAAGFLRGLLKSTALGTSRLRWTGAALALLSALYNLEYTASFSSERQRLSSFHDAAVDRRGSSSTGAAVR